LNRSISGAASASSGAVVGELCGHEARIEPLPLLLRRAEAEAPPLLRQASVRPGPCFLPCRAPAVISGGKDGGCSGDGDEAAPKAGARTDFPTTVTRLGAPAPFAFRLLETRRR
jgi:hypothetical protein